MRKPLIALVTAAAVTFTSSPAWAVEESGTLYCPEIFQTETARARAYGYLGLRGPGDSSYTYYYGDGWYVRENTGPGGYWRAYNNGPGGMDNGGTYAYCRN